MVHSNKPKKCRTPVRRLCIKKKYNLRSLKKSGSKKGCRKKSQRYAGHLNLIAIDQKNKVIGLIEQEIVEETNKLTTAESDLKGVKKILSLGFADDGYHADRDMLNYNISVMKENLKLFNKRLENAKDELSRLEGREVSSV